MKNNIFKISLFIEILFTIFFPPQVVDTAITTTYKYGFPFGYLSIYLKEKGTDYQLINILFKGNNGIDIGIILFIINIIFIYFLLYLIIRIIKIITNNYNN